MGTEGRGIAEFMKRTLDRVGLRVEFEALWGSDRVQRMTRCAYGITLASNAASIPDGIDFMSGFYSKAIGSANAACFADVEFDAAYEKAMAMPAGLARTELFRTMQTRLDVLASVRPLPSNELTFLKQPRVVGPFGAGGDWLQLMTLGVDERKLKAGQ